jgi:hypothetical protein
MDVIRLTASGNRWNLFPPQLAIALSLSRQASRHPALRRLRETEPQWNKAMAQDGIASWLATQSP